MDEKTPQQMQKLAVLTRARAEASIVRAEFLNKVLPAVEREFNRRLSAGEPLTFAVPSAEGFATEYVRSFLPNEAPLLGDSE